MTSPATITTVCHLDCIVAAPHRRSNIERVSTLVLTLTLALLSVSWGRPLRLEKWRADPRWFMAGCQPLLTTPATHLAPHHRHFHRQPIPISLQYCIWSRAVHCRLQWCRITRIPRCRCETASCEFRSHSDQATSTKVSYTCSDTK